MEAPDGSLSMGPARDCASDSLNIIHRVSPRARWVVCPLAAPEGTAGGLYTPGVFEKRKEDSK